jgi:AraC-like DNA-binding protein
MREEDKLMTGNGRVSEKRPYNLRERKIKDAPYRNMIRAELADELYDKIMNIIVLQKKYKDPNYSAKDLAKELKTNTRYLSAVINSRFGMNYSCLVNEYRIKDALHMLIDKRYAEKNVEEIGICKLTSKDVVRHPLVQKIVQAYDDYESRQSSRSARKSARQEKK